MNIEDAEMCWVLGILRPDDMPSVAIDVLNSGLDSTPIRILAGLGPSDLAEAPELFVALLESLHRLPMKKEQALHRYMRIICREIVDGRVTPYEGAKRIWRISLDSAIRTDEVSPFVYAASEYEERPEDREHFSAEIRAEAARVLAAEL